MKAPAKKFIKKVGGAVKRAARWIYLKRHAADEAAAVVGALKKAVKGKITPSEREDLVNKLEALALALRKAPEEAEVKP